MDDKRKTKAQLVEELEALRARIAELEGAAADAGGMKELEEKLRLMDMVVEQSYDGIATANEDGVIQYCNNAWADMHGYAKGEIEGKHLSMFHTREQLEKDVISFNEKMMKERFHQGEVGHKRKDGTTFPTMMTSFVLKNEEGELIGIVGMARDITELQKSGEAIRESEERFKLAAECASDLIFEWESGTNALNWFGDIDGALGYEKGEFPRTINAWLEAIHPDDQKRLAEAVRYHTDTGEPIDIEYRIKRKDGTWCYWTDRGAAVLGKDGKPVKHIGVCTDITDRKRHENELDIRNKISNIFLTSPDEEMYGDVFQAILEALGSKHGVFGYIDEEGALVCPSLTREVWDQCDIPEKTIVFPRETWGEDIWGRALTEGKTLYSNEPFKVPEGHIPIRNALDVPIIYQDEAIGNLLVGNKDTDYNNDDVELLESIVNHIAPILHARLQRDRREKERKQAEEEKKRLESQMLHVQKLESLGVLAGGIAHDFNNLLMGILGHADLAIMELTPESPACYNIEQVQTAAMRASELTNQMLAYSGRGRFVLEALNVNKVIEEMVYLIEVSIAKNAVLKLNLTESIPPIEADAAQIRQVILNLITNASDAVGDRSGVITITTGVIDADRTYLTNAYLYEGLAEGRYTYIEVSDTGTGMDTETIEKIFDPFFTTKFTGRGLGLAAVLGIVRGHDGTIKVYSEPGKGSTFKVLFPSSELQYRLGDRKAGIREIRDWRGSGTILIVDDEESIREVASLMLKRFGFDILTANDGKEAVEIYREHVDEIVCVLLDMTMPHMGGEEAFTELRRINPDVKVLLCSGYNEQDATSHFTGKGLAGFIQKPFQLEKLVLKIYRILKEEEEKSR